MINIFQPALGNEELEAVRRVFTSNWVGRGQITEQFEQKFAAFQRVPPEQVRSISCCTEGLFQTMALLEIGAGDEVILPSISFVGAANAVVAAGARPVFCDVDPRTLNATAADIERQMTPRTKAVILLHYGGVPCELDVINDLVAARGIAMIEDSACSVASRYQGRACGAWGDVGVWSFDAMKILVTGDGGMVYCRNPQLAARLARLIYLGLEQTSGFAQTGRDRWWTFEVSESGRRAIMNDIAAAIGLEQLQKLPAFIARRRQIHEAYDAALATATWLQRPPAWPAHAESSYYLYWIQTSPPTRDALAAHLRAHGIYTTFRYHPLHRVAYYRSDTILPNSDDAAACTLCLPLHQSLADDDLAHIIDCVARFPGR